MEPAVKLLKSPMATIDKTDPPNKNPCAVWLFLERNTPHMMEETGETNVKASIASPALKAESPFTDWNLLGSRIMAE